MKEAIALCKFKNGLSKKRYFFKAPTYSLKKGDEVDVQTRLGIERADVVAVMNYVTDEARQFMLDMEEIDEITGIVTAKYKKEEFKYEE